DAFWRQLPGDNILRRMLVRTYREARRLVWDVIPRRPLVRSAGLSHKSIANPVDTAFGKGVEANILISRLLADVLQADAWISFPVVLADDLLNSVGKPRYYLLQVPHICCGLQILVDAHVGDRTVKTRNRRRRSVLPVSHPRDSLDPVY